MLMLIFPPAEQQKFSSRNMTARTQWLDRFLLFCLHNKSFTPEIAENLSVGKQLWWLGKDDNFQDIMGCLIILHMGIGSSHWVQNTYPRWDFPEVPKEALKGYQESIGITSHGFLLSGREKWGRTNLELHFYLSLSQVMTEHKNITQNRFDEENGGKIGGRVLWPWLIP